MRLENQPLELWAVLKAYHDLDRINMELPSSDSRHPGWSRSPLTLPANAALHSLTVGKTGLGNRAALNESLNLALGVPAVTNPHILNIGAGLNIQSYVTTDLCLGVIQFHKTLLYLLNYLGSNRPQYRP